MCMFFVTRNLLESSLMQSHVTLYIYQGRAVINCTYTYVI